MTRPVRILLVTAGLSAAGTLVGAIAGVVALLLSLGFSGEALGRHALVLLAFPAVLGGVLGATLAPALAWALLRTVPLGVAFLATAAGTTAGGVIGWFVGGTLHDISYAIYGATLGLLATAVVLRVRYAPKERLPA